MSKTHIVVYLIIAGFLGLNLLHGMPPLAALAIGGMILGFDLTFGRMYRRDP